MSPLPSAPVKARSSAASLANMTPCCPHDAGMGEQMLYICIWRIHRARKGYTNEVVHEIGQMHFRSTNKCTRVYTPAEMHSFVSSQRQ